MKSEPMVGYASEPGSFRDRTGRVFYSDGAVFRGLSKQALKEWKTLSSTAFFRRLMAEGKLVYTEQVGSSSTPDAAQIGKWAAILKHQPIPFISYPYEWSFSMLKDAAMLQLDLLLAALSENMILKDASPFNIQWIGTNPVFIDIPSFEKLLPGEPWVGYRQFCQMFLYPLFLQAYKDVPFQPWLRGSIDGIEPERCNQLMTVRDLLRPGVFAHVYLQTKAQSLHAQTERDIKKDLRVAGFNQTLIKANVSRLRKIVQRLMWKRTASEWSDYVSRNTYTDTDREKKEVFVRQVVQSRPWRLVWDLGCNTGTFSRIAAENARCVVALDADQVAIDRLYQALKSEGQTTILPLVGNVADPSPNLGWRGLERKALTERGKPDLTLCLALIHHLVISANIPLKESVDWLAGLGTEVVIEFVTKADPMVQTLLRNKRDNYTDYEVEYFESCLAEAFYVVRREELTSNTRILYYAQVKR
jgi:SAM-dependent methyltransferase